MDLFPWQKINLGKFLFPKKYLPSLNLESGYDPVLEYISYSTQLLLWVYKNSDLLNCFILSNCLLDSSAANYRSKFREHIACEAGVICVTGVSPRVPFAIDRA